MPIIAEYPKPKKSRNKTGRRYRADYDLAYDFEDGRWTGYYRTLWGAKTAIFWHRHFASWGGSAVLVDVRRPA